MGGSKRRMGTRKQYPATMKAKIVLEILKEEKSIPQIASTYGIHPSILNRWKNASRNSLPLPMIRKGETIQKPNTRRKSRTSIPRLVV